MCMQLKWKNIPEHSMANEMPNVNLILFSLSVCVDELKLFILVVVIDVID